MGEKVDVLLPSAEDFMRKTRSRPSGRGGHGGKMRSISGVPELDTSMFDVFDRRLRRCSSDND